MWTLAQTLLITSKTDQLPLARQFSPLVLSAIANQESLSGLEIEMRKLEGVVKEIEEEMGYLEIREQRFAETNSA